MHLNGRHWRLGGAVVFFVVSSCTAPFSGEDTNPASQGARHSMLSDVKRFSGAHRYTLRITPEKTEVISVLPASGALNRRDSFRDSVYFYDLIAVDDTVLFSRGFPMDFQRRGEFADKDGHLTRFPVPDSEPVISIVVPDFEDASKLRFFQKRKITASGRGAEASSGYESPALIGEIKL